MLPIFMFGSAAELRRAEKCTAINVARKVIRWLANIKLSAEKMSTLHATGVQCQ